MLYFKPFGVSVWLDHCTPKSDFFLFHFFLFLKQGYVRYFFFSYDIGRVGCILFILQINTLRDRDKQRFKGMCVVSIGIEITIQLNGLFFIVLWSTWKLRCLENFPWRIFKISKLQGQPSTQRFFSVEPWV